MLEKSLLLIKPDAVSKKKIGAILQIIEDSGFNLLLLKMFPMDRETAERFYSIHREKPFYNKLIDFMTDGKIVAAVVEKENAIHDLRHLVGDTDPSKAAKGTIRNKYGETVTHNSVHASDSAEHAVTEIETIFPDIDF